MSFGGALHQMLVVLFSAAFTSNILLTGFLGMCSFLVVSRQVKAAIGLGWAVVFVLTATCLLNWLIYWYVLVPLHLEYLRFVVFMLAIAAFVQFVEMFIDRYSPALYQSLGIFLPLITVNCAILGAALFMVIREYSFLDTLGFGLGSGFGWMLAILALGGIQEKLKLERIPRGLQGPGIALIAVGLMALGFMGFNGVLGGN